MCYRSNQNRKRAKQASTHAGCRIEQPVEDGDAVGQATDISGERRQYLKAKPSGEHTPPGGFATCGA
jgi:hypothetical protein